MQQAFQKFIASETLFLPGDNILLTVSGGMDSVAMVHLFQEAKFTFGIAHCNFQLRGEESNEDEDFVRRTAHKLNVPFFTKRFFTTDYADLHGLSTQMAARELRYRWFEEIRSTGQYAFIATAHHLNDQVETFFINLMRNTGIAGLHGILPKQGNIIRPLLFTTRQEIERYVLKHNIAFREDSSNQEVKYLRNSIRHQIVPTINSISPGFSHVLNETISRLKETEMIFREAIENARSTIVTNDNEAVYLSIQGIKSLHPIRTYLFEFLSPYGFNFPTVANIVAALDEEPGKQFYSSTHRLLKDRMSLIITPVQSHPDSEEGPIEIHMTDSMGRIAKPFNLTLKVIEKSDPFMVDPSPTVANLDHQKLEFPLILRKWQKGDHFFPFGRNRKKKLSDFFVDEKFSIADKETCWLLWSGDKIVWVVGHRIDNRFRITSKTKEVLLIRLDD